MSSVNIAYQYDLQGYFVGKCEYFKRVPNNATTMATEKTEGFIPRWDGKKWYMVEDHTGKEGWLNGERTTIKEYGKLPKGWSDTEPEKVLTEEEQREKTQREFTAAIQQRLDAFAQERGYDNIASACSYYGSTMERFKKEADRALLLRDQTWAKGYEILEQVLSGKRKMPTLDEVLNELPQLTWE